MWILLLLLYAVPAQAVNCTAQFEAGLLRNDVCNCEANIEACNWDGGDCCFTGNAIEPACPGKFQLQHTNCDDPRFGWTLLLQALCPAPSTTLGNGVCDCAANTLACGWDGGDCCDQAADFSQGCPGLFPYTSACKDPAYKAYQVESNADAQFTALNGQVTTLDATVTSHQTTIDALSGYDLAELVVNADIGSFLVSADLADYATLSYVQPTVDWYGTAAGQLTDVIIQSSTTADALAGHDLNLFITQAVADTSYAAKAVVDPIDAWYGSAQTALDGVVAELAPHNLSAFVTESDLGTYVTSADLGTYLTATDLDGYATSASVQGVITWYATAEGELSSVVAQLTGYDLADFATQSSLTNYATTAQVGPVLTWYGTAEGQLATVISDVDALDLGSYAQTADLADYTLATTFDSLLNEFHTFKYNTEAYNRHLLSEVSFVPRTLSEVEPSSFPEPCYMEDSVGWSSPEGCAAYPSSYVAVHKLDAECPECWMTHHEFTRCDEVVFQCPQGSIPRTHTWYYHSSHTPVYRPTFSLEDGTAESYNMIGWTCNGDDPDECNAQCGLGGANCNGDSLFLGEYPKNASLPIFGDCYCYGSYVREVMIGPDGSTYNNWGTVTYQMALTPGSYEVDIGPDPGDHSLTWTTDGDVLSYRIIPACSGCTIQIISPPWPAAFCITEEAKPDAASSIGQCDISGLSSRIGSAHISLVGHEGRRLEIPASSGGFADLAVTNVRAVWGFDEDAFAYDPGTQAVMRGVYVIIGILLLLLIVKVIAVVRAGWTEVMGCGRCLWGVSTCCFRAKCPGRKWRPPPLGSNSVEVTADARALAEGQTMMVVKLLGRETVDPQKVVVMDGQKYVYAIGGQTRSATITSLLERGWRKVTDPKSRLYLAAIYLMCADSEYLFATAASSGSYAAAMMVSALLFTARAEVSPLITAAITESDGVSTISGVAGYAFITPGSEATWAIYDAAGNPTGAALTVTTDATKGVYEMRELYTTYDYNLTTRQYKTCNLQDNYCSTTPAFAAQKCKVSPTDTTLHQHAENEEYLSWSPTRSGCGLGPGGYTGGCGFLVQASCHFYRHSLTCGQVPDTTAELYFWSNVCTWATVYEISTLIYEHSFTWSLTLPNGTVFSGNGTSTSDPDATAELSGLSVTYQGQYYEDMAPPVTHVICLDDGRCMGGHAAANGQYAGACGTVGDLQILPDMQVKDGLFDPDCFPVDETVPADRDHNLALTFTVPVDAKGKLRSGLRYAMEKANEGDEYAWFPMTFSGSTAWVTSRGIELWLPTTSPAQYAVSLPGEYSFTQSVHLPSLSPCLNPDAADMYEEGIFKIEGYADNAWTNVCVRDTAGVGGLVHYLVCDDSLSVLESGTADIEELKESDACQTPYLGLADAFVLNPVKTDQILNATFSTTETDDAASGYVVVYSDSSFVSSGKSQYVALKFGGSINFRTQGSLILKNDTAVGITGTDDGGVNLALSATVDAGVSTQSVVIICVVAAVLIGAIIVGLVCYCDAKKRKSA